VCEALSPGDLNFEPYLSHLTNTYTCGVTIAPRMRGSICVTC